MKRVLTVLSTLILLVGCTSSGKPGSTGPAGVSGPTPSTSPATGGPLAATAPPAGPAATGAGDMVLARRGAGTAADGFVVLDGGNLRPLFELPAGVGSADWSVLYALSAADSGTRIRAIDPNGGGIQRELVVPGSWRLPAIGLDPTLAGLSGNGRTLFLEQNGNPAAASGSGRTRFAVVSTDLTQPARILSLPGALEFDAISPDGASLYVIEHLGGGASHYDVRRVDVAAGILTEGIIVDKRNVGEQMAGYAIAQVPGASGWVYTVYEGKNGPFIHALNTAESYAFCIDLPGGANTDPTSAAYWSLALESNGHSLYAANGALGVVAEISLTDYVVTRTSNLPTAAIVTLAKFGHGAVASGGHAAALNPDGTVLYVLREHGLLTVGTKDLKASGPVGAGAYESLTVSSSGAAYAIDGTSLVRIDPATGHQEASRAGGYNAIVAVVSAP